VPGNCTVSIGTGRSGHTPEKPPEELLEPDDELDEEDDDELLDEELLLDELDEDEELLLDELDDELLEDDWPSPPQAVSPNNTPSNNKYRLEFIMCTPDEQKFQAPDCLGSVSRS
jgi:hypothetical protein